MIDSKTLSKIIDLLNEANYLLYKASGPSDENKAITQDWISSSNPYPDPNLEEKVKDIISIRGNIKELNKIQENIDGLFWKYTYNESFNGENDEPNPNSGNRPKTLHEESEGSGI